MLPRIRKRKKRAWTCSRSGTATSWHESVVTDLSAGETFVWLICVGWAARSLGESLSASTSNEQPPTSLIWRVPTYTEVEWFQHRIFRGIGVAEFCGFPGGHGGWVFCIRSIWRRSVSPGAVIPKGRAAPA